MGLPSRLFAVVCASLAGILVVAGIAIATFTTENTPNLQEILHYEKGVLVSAEPKWLHLYGPVVFQLFGLGMLTFVAVRWERFVNRAIEAQLDFNERHGQSVDVGWTLRFCLSVVVGLEVMALVIMIYNSYRLLQP
jgi:hypothetical protein